MSPPCHLWIKCINKTNDNLKLWVRHVPVKYGPLLPVHVAVIPHSALAIARLEDQRTLRLDGLCAVSKVEFEAKWLPSILLVYMFNTHVSYGPKSVDNDHVHCNSSSLLTPIPHCMKLFVPLMPAGKTQQVSPATVVLQLQFMLCIFCV
jgi:hypothetical protein